MDKKRSYGGLSVWALSFGCIIGWGCFIMPGATFLPDAGPVGSVIGLVLAAFFVIIVSNNYGCMVSRFPDSPSSYIFTRDILGEDHAFLAIWSLGLAYLSLLWANATAFVLLARYLFGPVFEWGFHYSIAGYDVYGGEVLMGIVLQLLFGAVSVCAPVIADRLRVSLAVCLFGSVLVLFFNMLLRASGDFNSIADMPFSAGKPVLLQIINIAVLAPWLFVGFETVTQVVGKIKFPTKRLFLYASIAIICGMLTYIAIVLIAASGSPDGYSGWKDYTDAMGTLSGISGIPVFYNAYRLMGNCGLMLIGIAAFCALSTSMLGFMRASSRILRTMSDAKLLPAFLGKVNSAGMPVNATLTVLVISLPMHFLGRTAIGWNADVSTLSVAIVYTYVSVCVLITGRKEKNTALITSGIMGIIVSLISFFLLLLPNIFAVDALSKESYLMLGAWSLTGILYYWYMFRKDNENRFGHSVIMWVMMLSLLFFSTNIWVRLQLEDTMLGVLGERNMAATTALMESSLIQLVIIGFALLVIFNLFATLFKRQRELDTKLIKAEARSKAKTDFLSNMSHDLRTPMNAIIGFTELAQLEENNPENTVLYLDRIMSSGKHMLALINDVLEMSRIESGRIDINKAPTNVIEVMENIDSIMRGQAKAKNQSMSLDTSGIRHQFVNIDRLRLNQILMNLISNAVKYTDEGGKIDISARESAQKDFEYIFTVTDNGMGMSEEFSKKIFDAFEREDKSKVSGIQGTGLGMSITKRIVEAMGGTIEVQTKEGEGSSFIVTLEFDEAQPIEAEKKKMSNETEKSLKGIRVLLTDDMAVNREMARRMLERVGMVVDQAFDGKDALEKVKKADAGFYDVVLMDIQMPKMNGYQAASAIRALGDDKGSVPILAMTANAFDEDIKKALEAGMNGHVAKPIDMGVLMRKITEVI